METEEQNNPMEDAKKLLAEIKEANEESRKLLEMKQKQMAEDVLSGRSTAGQVPVPPKEETPTEYKDRIMRGGQ